mmetsp:Transcript_17243/g.36616  ORF Transcript_17243/g.36616 Transcript_17243/m.36616 type:complete len:216 (+) Transcript_17243:2-649(+)
MVGGLEKHRKGLEDLAAQPLVVHRKLLKGGRKLFGGLLLHFGEFGERVNGDALATQRHHQLHLCVMLHAEKANVAVLLEQGLEDLTRLLNHSRRGLRVELKARSHGVDKLGQHVHEASLSEEEGRCAGVKHVGLLLQGKLCGRPMGQYVHADLQAREHVGPSLGWQLRVSEEAEGGLYVRGRWLTHFVMPEEHLHAADDHGHNAVLDVVNGQLQP